MHAWGRDGIAWRRGETEVAGRRASIRSLFRVKSRARIRKREKELTQEASYQEETARRASALVRLAGTNRAESPEEAYQGKKEAHLASSLAASDP